MSCGFDDDIDCIMAIMRAAFDPFYGEAWTRQQVLDALLIGNCHYHLIDRSPPDLPGRRDPVGFYLSRATFEEEELLLIAVDPRARRQGIGRKLLAHLRESARIRESHRLILEMREDNPAVSLYKEFGFAQVGIRKKYYKRSDGSRNDAITFSIDLK